MQIAFMFNFKNRPAAPEEIMRRQVPPYRKDAGARAKWDMGGHAYMLGIVIKFIQPFDKYNYLPKAAEDKIIAPQARRILVSDMISPGPILA